MAGFKNQHLSYSRIARFEQCALSFKSHYVDGEQAEPGPPLIFGKLIHAVLERLMEDVMLQELSGPLSEETALACFREEWTSSGLSGLELFREGIDIIKDFVRTQGAVDHRDILAVEKEFHLLVGPFTVLGYVDRVDRVDDETVEIIDYKTNRMLFTRDEVDSSLQMSLYHLAAQQLWPWAKMVKLTFLMLRHGIRMTTERTAEQLDAALRYVETVGRMTEEATEFPPRLNTNCVWCDHHQQCPAYADALKGKRDFICEDIEDLEAVAREREEVARLAKILYARKSELEGVLKAHLQEHDELELAGTRYRMFNTTKTEYPLESTFELLEKATGQERSALLSRLAAIDKKALETLLKELAGQIDKPRLLLLKAELEAVAHKSYSPRFWAKAV
jgi:putative RecB family exonuclease